MGKTTLTIKTKQTTLQVADVSLNNNTEVSFSPPIVSSTSGQLVQPINITVPLERTLGSGNNATVRTVFILYENDTLFSNQGKAKWVISAILGKGVNSQKLRRPVEMEHKNENTKHGEKNKNQRNNLLDDVVRQQCVFWDPQHLVWSNKGCKLDTRTKPPMCKCNHLTSFALLVSRVEVQADVTLSVVSKVGCIVSVVALAATIILYLLNSEFRKKELVQIQLHVNFNLLIAYVIFLVGISLVDKGTGCTGVAALIQYFFLVAWMWIAVYSNKLYTSIVKVFNVGSTHYVLKACVVGYILPLMWLLSILESPLVMWTKST
uniref:Adhesion G-protein coupled receptor G7-like n=1 Tax=Phallusia mammillata TaxID=59560 RepID=A0A6F9D651_9ASCI|nr:adhesion G-protein coupled receptor G7-like [Phallusia mammillata]